MRARKTMYLDNFHEAVLSNFTHSKFFFLIPYGRKVWNHRKANADLITNTLNEYDPENEFSTTNIDNNVTILSQTILNQT